MTLKSHSTSSDLSRERPNGKDGHDLCIPCVPQALYAQAGLEPGKYYRIVAQGVAPATRRNRPFPTIP